MRDWVLVVTGIVWSIVALLLLAVTLVIAFVLRKYVNVAHDFLVDTVGGFLTETRGRAEDIRARTASLPGHDAPSTPLRAEAPHMEFSFGFPFFRRKRPWWRRLFNS